MSLDVSLSKCHEYMVEIRNLHFSRGSHVIFKDVNIKVPRGKITAIMGPSGTGKTTLLNLIGGQLSPDKGEILVEGQNIPGLSREGLYRARRQMGMLFQSGALFLGMNVFNNVAFPLQEHTNLPPQMIHDLVLMKLQAVGLRGAAHLMPNELSGGMARRVAIARAIALDPALMMYDEPFAGQDPISMGVLVKLIRLLNDALDMSAIIVTHDVHETLLIADYIYVIANGQVIGSGTPEEIMNSDSEWIKQFMRGLPDGPVPFHYPTQVAYQQDLWAVPTAMEERILGW